MKQSVLAAFMAIGACGPAQDQPRQVSAADVVNSEPGAAAAWPALLQHCLRNLDCDPLVDFGVGAGSASGVEEQAAWVSEIVGAGPHAIRIAFAAPRGFGGAAGRPLTLDETPASLRASRERASWLVVEHESGETAARPVRIYVRSANVALTLDGLESASSDRARIELTAQRIAGFAWPDDQRGVRITLSTKGAVLFVAFAAGTSAAAPSSPSTLRPSSFAPWVFEAEAEAGSDVVDRLIAAIGKGETLTLRLETPDGLILEDAVYTGGYDAALARATQALADPTIAEPLTVRCKDLLNEPDAFWLEADVSPARLACDPRPPTQRHADERAAQPSR